MVACSAACFLPRHDSLGRLSAHFFAKLSTDSKTRGIPNNVRRIQSKDRHEIFGDHGGLNEELITDDFEIWGPTVGTKDRDSYKKVMADIAHILPRAVTFDILGTVAEGDKVAIEATGSTTLADGRTYENIYHFLFEFRDGRIRRVKEHLDSKRAFDIFGAG